MGLTDKPYYTPLMFFNNKESGHNTQYMNSEQLATDFQAVFRDETTITESTEEPDVVDTQFLNRKVKGEFKRKKKALAKD